MCSSPLKMNFLFSQKTPTAKKENTRDSETVQEDACALAAQNGHLACLKFLHESGWAWGQETCNGALSNGHMECFEFARSKGCAFDESLLKY